MTEEACTEYFHYLICLFICTGYNAFMTSQTGQSLNKKQSVSILYFSQIVLFSKVSLYTNAT